MGQQETFGKRGPLSSSNIPSSAIWRGCDTLDGLAERHSHKCAQLSCQMCRNSLFGDVALSYCCSMDKTLHKSSHRLLSCWCASKLTVNGCRLWWTSRRQEPIQPQLGDNHGCAPRVGVCPGCNNTLCALLASSLSQNSVAYVRRLVASHWDTLGGCPEGS